MLITKIIDGKVRLLLEKVSPNVILNRFDIKYGNDFDLWKIDCGGADYFVATKTQSGVMDISLYMADISSDAQAALFRFLFDNDKRLKCIRVKYSKNPMPGVAAGPHWHIDLPGSVDKLNAGLSYSVRYNTRRYPRKISEQFGGIEIKHFARKDIPEIVLAEYFRLKEISHGRKYKPTYLDDYFITDCYVLYAGGRIASIAFTADTAPNVYFENITYDPDFVKFSPGMILYYHILRELIASGRAQFYLLGGDMEYKRHFGGIMTETYTYDMPRGYFYPSRIMAIAARMRPRALARLYRFLLPHRADKALFDLLAAK
ncbi:MAG: GNAT family N-acetyltransferase [Rickettsiales bacterium]|jgi:hypothetical protein|nr:GNAT family N-acetyltransferase [Rickettsiales bacterium]